MAIAPALNTGYGELAFGEGKFGGIVQVIVLANAGIRALSSVCQNVVDAWRRVSGMRFLLSGNPDSSGADTTGHSKWKLNGNIARLSDVVVNLCC